MPNSWKLRSDRLPVEEYSEQVIRSQLIHCIRASIGSTLFNVLTVNNTVARRTNLYNRQDLLGNGSVACVNYVSQILRLVDEGLWIGPAGTWMKYIDRDLQLAGWHKVSEEAACQGAIVIWDIFRSRLDKEAKLPGNRHVGFVWTNGTAVSIRRENPLDLESPRSPQVHPLRFDKPLGKIDGPRKPEAFWSHPKLHQ